VELIEWRLERLGQSQGSAAGHGFSSRVAADRPERSTSKRRGKRLPTEVLLVVAHRGPHRRRPVVVDDDQAAWSDDLAEEVEIDEHLVEPVAAIHERRVGVDTLAHESGQRDRRGSGH
jgi:hypothetical protein